MWEVVISRGEYIFGFVELNVYSIFIEDEA